ncbi:MAG: rhomboid family intramembrane serine protease [Gemmatimonadetes bacterium]|nr:rhomboid family intramembrane serine protease [Gemmatimonadota bacterium]
MPSVPTRVTRSATSLATTVKAQALTLGTPLGVSWAALGANTILGGALNHFGIIPRTERGLWGILFAPFLHGNFAHLAANSVSLLILGWLTLAFAGQKRFWIVSAASALGAGLTAWTLGAPGSVHIGASGVIFGYLGYLMLSGWFARRVMPVLVSLGVTVMWGGMVLGVLPGQAGISWQAHLGGFIGGVFAARALHARQR